MPMLLTNSTPGGFADPEDYTPPAVSIAAGASIKTPGTSDAKKVTLSGWFKVDALPTGKWTALHYFNRIGDDEGPNPCALVLSYLGTFEVTFQGHAPLPAFVTVRNIDADPAFEFGEWNHVYLTADLDAAEDAKNVRLHLNGGAANLFDLTIELDNSGPLDINLSTSAESPLVGKFPGDGTYFNIPATFVSVPIEACNVLIWHGLFINPAAGTTVYSAKEGVSYIIRDCVNYMNSRGVNPVEALAAMWIETVYGTFGAKDTANGRQNLFQFLSQSPYDLILGYAGQKTRALDQYTAFANAWTGFKSSLYSAAKVALPNDYPRVVRNATGEDPEPYQLYLIHILGGSTGVTSQVNGDNLLRAMVEDDTQELSEVASSISNMTGQTKIWGSAGPLGLFTSSFTVAQAISAMETVWGQAETDALTKLDAGSNSNLSQFIDGDGFPMPPTVAVEKFGFPTFWFSGAADEFVTNFGSGGAVTVSGSITDALEGPGV